MVVAVQQIIFNFLQVNSGGSPREVPLRFSQELLWGTTSCHPLGTRHGAHVEAKLPTCSPTGRAPDQPTPAQCGTSPSLLQG